MTPRRRSHARPAAQRGMVTVVAMLFLVATVVFGLTQMLNMSSGNVAESQRQADRTAAFFLAESGLEQAQASLAAALVGSYTNNSCTGIASTYTLGRGTVGLSAVSSPANCDNSGATPCGACTVTSVGRVGNTQSTLTQDMNLTVRNGVYCNGATTDCANSPTLNWQLQLQNTAAVAGIGLFALTYDEQGNNQASCAAASNCRLQMSVSSPAAGNNSVGLMGNAVLIPAGSTYPIYQTMTKGRNNLAEVGGFFLGTSAPTLTGPTTAAGAASYWNTRNNDATSKTVGSNGSSTGGTNDGTATSGGTCAAPGTTTQSCTSWCQGGDMLVFSFSANVTQLSDELSGVTFGTNASAGQNVAMTRIAKYPSPQVTGAPANVDAEIWYARNPNFTGASPLAVNASSYKGRGSGAVGARWVSNNADTTSISSGTLTVGASFTGPPGQVISVGDTVSWSGGNGNPSCPTNTSCGTVTAQVTPLLANEQLGGRGRYQLSGALNVPSANNRTWTVSSTVLRVSACTVCHFAAGDALSGLVSGRSISSQATPNNGYGATEATGGVGRYALSGAATYVAPGTNLYAGTPGSTLYLPATSSQPTVTSPQMLIALKSGTGAITPGTRVTAVSAANAATTAFTVSTTPTTPLDGATLCAGTCAFFVPNTDTTFALGGVTANFNGWAGGFTCLKGVDLTPQPVTSSTTSTARWTEAVQ
ncbi:hypothetical protein [Azohydromonas lata]|uniref:Type 4 fimbrial biogenesis protein PilX N-terminal domain-containing protein n=1 Tax=Azohydromonas lata TaxID=45677 RepID=A0ABU5IEC9_9BURK|nr:hypothetical protein [Azohydromonas lata]MDZ5457020.1 hypothetical protein [Azohydromonas lata]